jgi:hypothetical protein
VRTKPGARKRPENGPVSVCVDLSCAAQSLRIEVYSAARIKVSDSTDSAALSAGWNCRTITAPSARGTYTVRVLARGPQGQSTARTRLVVR